MNHYPVIKSTYSKIGFDDRLLMFVMIPVVAFVIPYIFSNVGFNDKAYYTWTKYGVTLIVTAANWIGSRYVMILARKRYPEFYQTRKRLIIQSAGMLIYMLTITNLACFIIGNFCGLHLKLPPYRSVADEIFSSNCAAFICTLTVVAIYESRYFMNELKHSVQEREFLRRESLEAQLSALKTQVNPHFLFNNLNTLCSIIPENPVQAVDFVQQLSKLYRHILEVKDEPLISLADELEVIKAYVFLLKTRFADNLQIDFDIADSDGYIVPLALQLLVENAIKHNIVSADRHLNIRIFTGNGKITVTNNLQKKNQTMESTSLGLNNIRNRYKLLTHQAVTVTETENEFIVSLPLIRQGK